MFDYAVIKIVVQIDFGDKNWFCANWLYKIDFALKMSWMKSIVLECIYVKVNLTINLRLKSIVEIKNSKF